jgi:hypothetical protein
MSRLHGAIFDKRQCELGEWPFWHPQLKRLFGFDITQKISWVGTICRTG